MARTIRLRTIGAGGGGNSPAFRPQDTWLDLREQGIRASDPTDTIQSNLQALIDAQNPPTNGRLWIYSPEHLQIKYPISLPDGGHATVIGDSVDTSSISYQNGYCGDILRVGFPMKVGGVLDPARFVSLTGILDGTQGTRYGLRVGGTGEDHVAFMASALRYAAGGFWGDQTAVTIDMAVYDLTGYGALFGSGAGLQFHPFLLANDAAKFWVGMRGADGSKVIANMGLLGLWPGVLRRISVQITSGRIVLFVDKSRTAVVTSGVPATPFWSGKDTVPFRVGGEGGRAAYVGTASWGPTNATTPFTLAGLKVSFGAKYVDQAGAQTRVDGQPITDLRTYFTRETDTVAYLPLDESGATAAPTRRVAIVGQGSNNPNVRHSGVFLSGWQSGVANSPGHQRVEDITLNGAHGLGMCIAAGVPQYARFRDVRCVDGFNGYGTWPWEAAYQLWFDGLRLRDQRGPAIALYMSQAIFRDSYHETTLRCGIDATQSKAEIHNSQFDGFGNPKWIAKLQQVSWVEFHGGSMDWESDAGMDCAFLIRISDAIGSFSPHAGRLGCYRMNVGYFAPGKAHAYVESDDQTTNVSHKAWITWVGNTLVPNATYPGIACARGAGVSAAANIYVHQDDIGPGGPVMPDIDAASP